MARRYQCNGANRRTATCANQVLSLRTHVRETLASRILSLLGERTAIRGQDAIGSIMVEDPNMSPPVDAILCRKNVTEIWQLAVGVEAGHKPAMRCHQG